MATRVGTAVTGTNDAASNTVASAAKDTTGASMVVGSVKWEVSGPTISGIADTAGNTYSWTELANGGTEPHNAVYWTTSAFTSNASNVVTITFSASTATFKRIIQDAWSGLTSTVQASQTATGTTSPYSTASLTTTGPGLVYAGVGDFSTLTNVVAAGTPTFTLAANTGDSFAIFYISSTGQTITPAATADAGTTKWSMVAKAFADIASAPVGKTTPAGPLSPRTRGPSFLPYARPQQDKQSFVTATLVLGKTPPVGPLSPRARGPSFLAYARPQRSATPIIGSPDVTLGLSGVQSAQGLGTIIPAINYGLTGAQGSGATGNLTANLSGALTGASATGGTGGGTPNITYTLTGVQATGGVGTVTAVSGTFQAITGVAATGQVGSVIPNIAYAVTGIAGSSGIGFLAPGTQYTLSGIASSALLGNVTANLANGLGGVAATGAPGGNTPNVTYALAGVQASGQVGNVAIQGDVTIALTGVQGAGQVGNIVSPAPGPDPLLSVISGYIERKKKAQTQNDREWIKPPVIEFVDVQPKPRRWTIRLADLVGKQAAVAMSTTNLELTVKSAAERRRRQKEDDDFLLLF